MGQLAGETMIPTAVAREMVAKYRPVTLRTVQKWIAKGWLEAIQVSGRFLTSKEAVERFLASGK